MVQVQQRTESSLQLYRICTYDVSFVVGSWTVFPYTCSSDWTCNNNRKIFIRCWLCKSRSLWTWNRSSDKRSWSFGTFWVVDCFWCVSDSRKIFVVKWYSSDVNKSKLMSGFLSINLRWGTFFRTITYTYYVVLFDYLFLFCDDV